MAAANERIYRMAVWLPRRVRRGARGWERTRELTRVVVVARPAFMIFIFPNERIPEPFLCCELLACLLYLEVPYHDHREDTL